MLDWLSFVCDCSQWRQKKWWQSVNHLWSPLNPSGSQDSRWTEWKSPGWRWRSWCCALTWTKRPLVLNLTEHPFQSLNLYDPNSAPPKSPNIISIVELVWLQECIKEHPCQSLNRCDPNSAPPKSPNIYFNLWIGVIAKMYHQTSMSILKLMWSENPITEDWALNSNRCLKFFW